MKLSLSNIHFVNNCVGLQSVGKTSYWAAVIEKARRSKKGLFDGCDYAKSCLTFKDTTQVGVLQNAYERLAKGAEVSPTNDDRVEFTSTVVVKDRDFFNQDFFEYMAVDSLGGAFLGIFEGGGLFKQKNNTPNEDTIKKYSEQEGVFKCLTVFISMEQFLECPNYNLARCTSESARNCQWYKTYQCKSPDCRKTTCHGCVKLNPIKCTYYNKQFVYNAVHYLNELVQKTHIPICFVITKCADKTLDKEIEDRAIMAKRELQNLFDEIWSSSIKPPVFLVDSVEAIQNHSSKWYRTIDLPILYHFKNYLKIIDPEEESESWFKKLFFGSQQENYDRILRVITQKLETEGGV